MRTLKIPFPDISFYEKTRLTNPDSNVLSIESGQTSIYVRNVAGLSVNDFIVLDAFESEDAEIVRISAIDSYAKIVDLSSETQQPHSIGVVIYKTPYNQVRVYKGTSTTVATHVLQTTLDLRPDNAYTIYTDATGTTTDYYSYAYYNSQSTLSDTQTLYVDSDYDSVLTVQQLKQWFMFGLDLTDDSGYAFPDSMFVFAIKAAIDSLEKVLQIKIKPTTIFEYQDYFRQDYLDFAFIQLNEWPIQSVERLAIKYPTSTADIVFPSEWIQLRTERGQIHLIPTSGSLSQIMIGQGGDYLTFVWRGWDWMPNLWRINYTAGFASGQVPNDIIAVIGKMACYYPLNIAGDLVGGVAIASKSIGVDGLSQSINTTSSPENAGYSARLRQYERELKVEIPRLQAYYKGVRMAVL